MTNEYLVFWAQIAQGWSAITTVIVSLYIAVLVHRYTKRKDALDIIRYHWQEQQGINLATIQSSELLNNFENLVYGSTNATGGDGQKFFYIFLILNGLQHFFLAHKYRLISKKELYRQSEGSAKLIKREQNTVIYLLEERGYDQEFAAFVKDLLAGVLPPKPLHR